MNQKSDLPPIDGSKVLAEFLPSIALLSEFLAEEQLSQLSSRIDTMSRSLDEVKAYLQAKIGDRTIGSEVDRLEVEIIQGGLFDLAVEEWCEGTKQDNFPRAKLEELESVCYSASFVIASFFSRVKKEMDL